MRSQLAKYQPAMLGQMFILDDRIFNGLAISLIFGMLLFALLALVVIPVLHMRLVVQENQLT